MQYTREDFHYNLRFDFLNPIELTLSGSLILNLICSDLSNSLILVIFEVVVSGRRYHLLLFVHVRRADIGAAVLADLDLFFLLRVVSDDGDGLFVLDVAPFLVLGRRTAADFDPGFFELILWFALSCVAPVRVCNERLSYILG